MVDLPNPLKLIPGRTDDVPVDVAGEGPSGRMADDRRPNVTSGSRVGSPNVLVAMPFSSITVDESDGPTRHTVIELAGIVAELVAAVEEIGERSGEAVLTDALRDRLLELRERLDVIGAADDADDASDRGQPPR